MNNIRVSGDSFEVVAERAKARSLTPDYQDCGVHVNASVVKTTKNGNGLFEFIVIFGLSDWYDSDSTVATYVNGVDRAV